MDFIEVKQCDACMSAFLWKFDHYMGLVLSRALAINFKEIVVN